MLEKLEDLIKQSYEKFSPNQKKISDLILAQHEKYVMLTITQCSQMMGVSEASLTRFTKALGFKGYNEFQNYLRTLLLSQLNGKNKLLTNLKKESSSQNFLQKSIMKDIENMTHYLQSIDEEKFESVVQTISASDRLFIVGLGISKSLVDFLEFRFRRIGADIKALTTGGRELIENLLPLKSGDVILAIGFQRSYGEISVALDYANRVGASTIALVENPLSPLAGKSQLSLIVKRGPTDELNSLAFPMTVCNALVLRVAMDKEQQALKAMENLDWLKNACLNNSDT